MTKVLSGRSFFFLVVSMALFLPRTAQADPVAVTGSVTVIRSGPNGISDFSVQGPFFDLQIPTSVFSFGFGSWTQFPCDTGCGPGQARPTFMFQSGLQAIGTVGDRTFGVVHDEDPIGELSLSAPMTMIFTEPVTVPSFSAGSPVTITGPFTLGGMLEGVETFTGSFVFRTQIRGGGTAFINLRSREDNLYHFESARFELTPVDPVPEPSTLVLLSAAATLLIRRRFAILK